jgi:hypothetical protein
VKKSEEETMDEDQQLLTFAESFATGDLWTVAPYYDEKDAALQSAAMYLAKMQGGNDVQA